MIAITRVDSSQKPKPTLRLVVLFYFQKLHIMYGATILERGLQILNAWLLLFSKLFNNVASAACSLFAQFSYEGL